MNPINVRRFIADNFYKDFQYDIAPYLQLTQNNRDIKYKTQYVLFISSNSLQQCYEQFLRSLSEIHPDITGDRSNLIFDGAVTAAYDTKYAINTAGDALYWCLMPKKAGLGASREFARRYLNNKWVYTPLHYKSIAKLKMLVNNTTEDTIRLDTKSSLSVPTVKFDTNTVVCPVAGAFAGSKLVVLQTEHLAPNILKVILQSVSFDEETNQRSAINREYLYTKEPGKPIKTKVTNIKGPWWGDHILSRLDTEQNPYNVTYQDVVQLGSPKYSGNKLMVTASGMFWVDIHGWLNVTESYLQSSYPSLPSNVKDEYILYKQLGVLSTK
ncbi:hypothetical protein D3C78_18860 [compost metagenome]